MSSLAMRSLILLVLSSLAVGPGAALSHEPYRNDHFESSDQEAMQFRMAGSGGNCLACTWIAAEGVIVPGTAQKFSDFISRTETAGSGLFVHLNSVGGDVVEAMELGRRIRSNNLNTAVSQTIGQIRSSDDPKFDKYVTEYPTTEDKTKPKCLSACALAFAGGYLRLAEEKVSDPIYLGFGSIGPLGVHQFYAPEAWEKPEAHTSTAIDRLLDQAIVSQISGYLEEMSIKPLLLSIMAKTPPFDIHVLSGAELFETNIVNNEKYEADLTGYKNGVAVAEIHFQKQDGSYKIEMFCKAKKIQMFMDADWHVSPTWNDIASWHVYEDVVLENTAITVRLITKNSSSNPDATVGPLLFEFQTDASNIAQLKEFRFTQEPGLGNRYSAAALASLSFKLPNGFEGLHVLPKTCL